jgi:hypothetical protein
MAATRPRHSKEDFVAAGIHAALLLLLEAYEYAQELQRNHWDFAVALHTLRLAGLTESQLRWLVCRGYVEHAAEIAPAEKGRRFRRTGQLTFTDKTCVVLTELGASVARQVGQAHKRRSHPRDKAALAWRGDTIYERDVRPHLKASSSPSTSRPARTRSAKRN